MFQSYKIPISVKGIIFEDNKVWLRKNERNEWELPGGKLDATEQPEETAIRELREELGFRVKVQDIIQANLYKIKSSEDEAEGVLILSYLCKFVKKVGYFEERGEAGLAQFQKFSIKEVLGLNMPKFYKEAIEKAWDKIK